MQRADLLPDLDREYFQPDVDQIRRQAQDALLLALFLAAVGIMVGCQRWSDEAWSNRYGLVDVCAVKM